MTALTRAWPDAEVRDYLTECAAHPGLDHQYHPTADGAVKVIWHRGPDEADQIRDTFSAITASPGPAPVLRSASLLTAVKELM
jgi:hypothetical protein